MQASVVVVHELRCPTVREVFPDQGLNHCPLHCKVDSTGSPEKPLTFAVLKQEILLEAEGIRVSFVGKVASKYERLIHKITCVGLMPIYFELLQFPSRAEEVKP